MIHDLNKIVANKEVIEHVHCRQCGYDLYQLRIDGECPECGTKTYIALNGDLLQYCDSPWLEKILSSRRCFLAAFLLALALPLLGMLLIPFKDHFSDNDRTGLGKFPIWIYLISVISIFLLGVWRWTAPNKRDAQTIARTDVIARIIAIAIILCVVLIPELQVASPTTKNTTQYLLVTLFILFLYRVQYLSKRLPDPQLSSNSATAIVCILLGVVLKLLEIWNIKIESLSTEPYENFVNLLVTFVEIAASISFLWGIIMLAGFYRKLSRIVVQAREFRVKHLEAKS